MNSSIRLSMLFIFLLSTAYIAFELCAAYAEPATFVVIRTSLAAGMLFLIVVIQKIKWPRRFIDIAHAAIVGVLIHGIYAVASFSAIYHGMDVSLCALILSLQPLLTVLLSATFLGEKITVQKFSGVIIGLAGVSLMILQGNANTIESGVNSDTSPGSVNNALTIGLCFVSLLAISIGTIIQKRFRGEASFLPGSCIQFCAAAIFILPFALILESMEVQWSTSFIFGLGWLVVFVSIGAMSLFMMLIRHGEAGSVANLFYLVTPLVAIQAWVFFGDELSSASVSGMILCLIGVLVVNHVPVTKPTVTAVKQGQH